MRELNEFLGRTVKVIVDRPSGSRHPENDMIYPINYGYIPETISGDGEEIDVYIVDSTIPMTQADVKIIAIVNRLNDIEDKLVGVINDNVYYTDEHIMSKIMFTEKWFKSRITR